MDPDLDAIAADLAEVEAMLARVAEDPTADSGAQDDSGAPASA